MLPIHHLASLVREALDQLDNAERTRHSLKACAAFIKRRRRSPGADDPPAPAEKLGLHPDDTVDENFWQSLLGRSRPEQERTTASAPARPNRIPYRLPPSLPRYVPAARLDPARARRLLARLVHICPPGLAADLADWAMRPSKRRCCWRCTPTASCRQRRSTGPAWWRL